MTRVTASVLLPFYLLWPVRQFIFHFVTVFELSLRFFPLKP
jgi:hypothetical protein